MSCHSISPPSKVTTAIPTMVEYSSTSEQNMPINGNQKPWLLEQQPH
jgi:hypothetical protein